MEVKNTVPCRVAVLIAFRSNINYEAGKNSLLLMPNEVEYEN